MLNIENDRPPSEPRLVDRSHICVTLTAILLAGVLAGCSADPGDQSAETTASATFATKYGNLGSRDENTLNYFSCANEGQTCVIEGNKYAAFGGRTASCSPGPCSFAAGTFTFKAITGSFTCGPAAFDGVSPDTGGMPRSCWVSNYSLAVSEGGIGNAGFRDVAFGVDGIFSFKNIGGSFTCDRNTFGEPSSATVGKTKACYVAVKQFSQVASENQPLTNLANTPVAYGASGAFNFKILSGSAVCNNSTFANSTFLDPAIGVTKRCYKFPYNLVADENGSFTPSTNSTAFYGTGLDGNFLSHNFPAGVPVACTNATFGADPAVGAPKHCYLAAAS